MSTIDERALQAAEKTELLATFAMLREAGISQRSIRRRLAADIWTRRGRWTVQIAPGAWTWKRQVVAAVLEAAPGAAASHVTAAALYGIWPEERPRPLHVVVPRGTRPLKRKGVVLHTTVTDFEPARPRGVVATPVPRTLRDVAATETLADTAFALRAARRTEIITPAQLEAEIAVGGPGSRRLRDAFEVDESYGLKSESWLEDHALPALARSSLPRFVTQYPIDLGAGRYVRPDVAWPDVKLALEWLGVKWHSSGVAVAKDELKHDDLEAAGWHVEYAGSEALAGAPFRALVARLHRLHAERLAAAH